MRLSPELAQLMGLGMYVAVCIAGGAVGGFFLDRWLGTGKILTMSGLALGIFFAAYGGYRTLADVFAISSKDAEKKQ